MTPRTDQTKYYEHRIQLATTNKCPPFFLQTKYIMVGHTSTKVWNVYADNTDINAITEELKTAFNTPEFRQFYSWKEFNSLHNRQQTTVLQLNNKFTTEYRSLLIKGFKSNLSTDTMIWEDNIPIKLANDDNEHDPKNWMFEDNTDDIIMHDESMLDRFHLGNNLKTTTISTFIHKCFKSGDGTELFDLVYPPIMGTCEVLVRHHHIPEALDLFKTIHIELCRTMNHKAILLAYDDPDPLLQATTTTEIWQPYDIQSTITNAPGPPQDKNYDQPRNKRTKLHPSTRKGTYADITSNYQNKYTQADKPTYATQPAHAPPYSTPTNEQPEQQIFNSNNTIIHLNTVHELVLTLQHEMKSMKTSISNVNEKIDNTNSHHEQALQCIELKQTTLIEELESKHKQQINDIGNAFISQLKVTQSKTEETLTTILREREVSLENKFQESFQILLAQFQPKQDSPTRKKQILQLPNNALADITPTENQETSNHGTNTNARMDIINPYKHNALRRRSVPETLPTTQS
jgi:hypothetical protein